MNRGFRVLYVALVYSGLPGLRAADPSEAIDVPVLTVCQALSTPAKYSGQVVVIVGRWLGTGEGSWLDENCGTKVVIGGRSYPTAIWTSYTPTDSTQPPEKPKEFAWNRPVLQRALAEVKKTTRLESRAKWYAVYGRLEVTNDFGVGHLNAAPAQLVWPTRGGYLRLK